MAYSNSKSRVSAGCFMKIAMALERLADQLFDLNDFVLLIVGLMSTYPTMDFGANVFCNQASG